MGDFRIVKSLVGDTVEAANGKAHAALEEGDLGKWNTNRIEKVGNNDTADQIVIVKEDASTQDDDVQYAWLDPWVLIEGKVEGTIAEVGDHVHIDVTGGNIKFEGASTTRATAQFIVREIVDATDKVVRATRIPADLNAT